MVATVVLAGLVVLAGPQDRPNGYAEVTACRAVSDASQRLACFDRSVAALDEAAREGRVAILDRDQIARTRQEAFGFSVPSLSSVFGAAAGPEIEEIRTTLESANRAGGGGWVFRLADGSVWRQADASSAYFPNRTGEPVRVRRAALGSYLLTVASGGTFRVRRY